MALSIKDGVRVEKLHSRMVEVMESLTYLMEAQLGLECVVTSASDGKHKKGSLHYQGRALDFRTKHIPRERVVGFCNYVGAFLGNKYDVILEGLNTANEHLHIEYDPEGEA